MWSQRYANTEDLSTMRNFFASVEAEHPPSPPPPPPAPQPQTSSRSPSNREREQRALDELTGLLDRVSALRRAIKHDLRPGQVVQASVIANQKLSVRKLLRELDGIPRPRPRPASVDAMRERIKTNLADIQRILDEADTAPTPPKDSVTVDSREYRSSTRVTVPQSLILHSRTTLQQSTSRSS